MDYPTHEQTKGAEEVGKGDEGLSSSRRRARVIAQRTVCRCKSDRVGSRRRKCKPSCVNIKPFVLSFTAFVFTLSDVYVYVLVLVKKWIKKCISKNQCNMKDLSIESNLDLFTFYRSNELFYKEVMSCCGLYLWCLAALASNSRLSAVDKIQGELRRQNRPILDSRGVRSLTLFATPRHPVKSRSSSDQRSVKVQDSVMI
uniref:G_PROTEIN_RECEP_F1_2 domain-containing protein n=1 Tax=Steinernema glaseri TaxID=37863 RepID=A0A1I7Z6B9_9BILA